MKSLFCVPALAILFSLLLTASSVAQQVPAKAANAKTPASLNFKMKSIDGKDVDLSKYAGKVVVFVNVASKCGFTPQYKDLQKLHETYKGKGVAIVGVPCNQFGGQEPGTNEEVAKFCQSEYGVEFDMLSKVDVKGSGQCGLYKYLTAQDIKPAGKGPIKWNFEKIVLDKAGKPIARFGSRTKPTSKSFTDVLEVALKGETSATGHYSHKSEKLGKTYYLFKKEIALKNSDKIQTIYFFGKDKDNPKGTPLAEVPQGKVVSETKTGMLVLKNKD